MLKTLKQPYPLQIDLKHNATIACVAGLCVFSIFYFFRPFGLEKLDDTKIALLGLQYATITIILSLFCNFIIPKLFPKLFNEKHWTVLSEIFFLLFIITTIAIANLIFTSFAFKTRISGTFFLKMLSYTIGFGIVPILFSVLVKQRNLLRKYSNEAVSIDNLIAEKNEEAVLIDEPKKEISILEIKGNNQKELLTIQAKDFLYAEAADNYTAIHFLKNNNPEQVLFRMSIKNLEEQHPLSDSLFRCHKSYIINLQHVNHISGNAQGYSLHIFNNDTKIPVSRSLNVVIKEKISSYLQK
jgi:hypothetical protein